MIHRELAEEAYRIARAIDKEHTAKWISVIESYLDKAASSARRAAIEEAAKVCDEWKAYNHQYLEGDKTLACVADEIRDLLDELKPRRARKE